MKVEPLEPPQIPQHNQGAMRDTKIMDKGVMAMTLDITEGHTNLMLMVEPVTKKGNDVPTMCRQARFHSITIAVEVVEAGDMITMNKCFETRC